MSSRYIINVTSHGARLFSTSRSSIGNDKAKLATLTKLFANLVPVDVDVDDDPFDIEVVLIGDATAQTCMLDGTPLGIGDAVGIGDPALGEHPVAKANAASWDFKSKKTKTEWHGPGVAAGPVEWVESLQDNGPPITHADFGNDRYVIRPLLMGDASLLAGYSLTCNNINVCDFYGTLGEAKDAAIAHANA